MQVDSDYIKKLEERCEFLEAQCAAQRITIESQAADLKFDVKPRLVEEIKKRIVEQDHYIFDLYPWGEKTEYSILGSVFKLDEVEDESHVGEGYKNKTDWQLIAEIHEEINRASNYLCNQTVLFNYDGELKDGFHEQRVNVFVYSQLLVNGIGFYTPERNWTVKYKPLVSLITRQNGPSEYKINYTRQELCAIHLIMAQGEFENLC